MSTVVSKMGDVAKEILELYYSDLIQDGMYIGISGEEHDFIWMVREAGTDIVDLNKLPIKIIRNLIEDRINMNKRIFLLGRLNTEEEYFIELTRSPGYKKTDAHLLMDEIKKAYGQIDRY